MERRMKLGDYLVAYLKRIGVSHLFGIPGDLVINLFLKFGRPKGLKIITLSHEPGIGFAADGYARSTGRIGVICVTYGAGGHNMVNPVAGSFSERVPILVISGGPGEEERKLGVLIHHQAKEIESQLRIYREVTCAAKTIDDPIRAARDIDDVIRSIWLNQQPGYLEIHRDMVEQEIPIPNDIVAWDGELPYPHSDRHKIKEAVRETAERFNHADNPVVLVGIEAYRFKSAKEIVRLVEKMGVPCCTSVLAKGAFPMNHPLYMGVYAGVVSPTGIRARVENADLILSLGMFLTDIEMGGSEPPEALRQRRISSVENHVDIGFHTYTNITLRDFVYQLLRSDLKHHREQVTYYDNLGGAKKRRGQRILVADVLREINYFLAQRKGYMAVAESGDSLFGGIDIKVGNDGLYLAQGFYASMGFAVPGALGAQIGTRLRPLILTGDGGFQMTGAEIAHARRYGLNPIVILLNNGGWGIFRPIAKRQDLLALPSWHYAELARLWGGQGYKVQTAAELRGALDEASGLDDFAIIEVSIGPSDLSPITLKYIRASAKKAQMNSRS
ncbi:MAG TPA: thiamine pyrophosphate-binding protein [Candidatus Polarisedimenticolaceae bacterium]|nr:thiamine pyrophosphate-binding protein [Candidatus Polarisedimenticolaceae bacterium]